MLDEVIDRINRPQGQEHSVRLELWKWEDAVPQIGPQAQDVIDAQTPSYDIYLGIMAYRFGTQTGEYGSGTEKEFEDAVKQWGKVGKPWILFYFNEAAVNPTTLDLEQYAKVNKFREQIQKQGLYANYDGIRGAATAFFEQVELHLRGVIPHILQLSTAAAKPKSKATPVGKKQPAKPTIPQAYLDWLQRQCADIDLLGLEIKEGRSLKLNHVYVPVTTQAHTDVETDAEVERELRTESEKPQLLLDLLNKRSLYVSGDPGSGKSTFCRWAAWLACVGSIPDRVPPEPEDYTESVPDSFQGRLPLLVRLREFWEHLPHDPGDRLSLDRFEEALSSWLHKTNPTGLSWPNVLGHLQQGTALLILDGVDEVPVSANNEAKTWNPRSLLISGLTEAISTWGKTGNRILLTSRPYGLGDVDRQRLQLPHAPLQPLARPLQDLLVRRWFGILREDEGEKLAKDMFHDIRGRADVDELSANPMLLTAMCIIYNEGKRLPEDRCDLYAKIVEYVLYGRFKVPTEREMVHKELCVVAHAMHAGISDKRTTPQAQVKYDEIDRALEAYREQRRYTQSGFEDLQGRREQLLSQTGLLVPRGDDEAEFYHLSIQEFLAAQWLWAVSSDRLSEVIVQRAEVPEWRNTLAFLFGTQLSKVAVPDPSIRLLEKLIEETRSHQLGVQIVLGDCLQILRGKKIRLRQEQEDKYRQMCVTAIENEVALRERNLLGLALGHVGDPRIVTDLRDYENDQAWVKVPVGNYRVGDNDKSSYRYLEPLDEQEFLVKKPCCMTRFPVTNCQYELFLKEDGYQQQEFWSDEGWIWCERNNATEPEFWRNAKWNAPNQPVVTVTFWEAEAFCKWANGELPSEKQWEAAARGPEGREYPWGNEWEDGICNSSNAELGVTSPVGLFPRSRSLEFGFEDMAGNVWEWCRDKYSKESNRRVLRGGSFNYDTDGCRSAVRSYWLPGNHFSFIGFRVSRTYP